MSSSLYKFETEGERLDRLKRLKLEGIKKQLRAARLFVEKQGGDASELTLQNSGNQETAYTFLGHAAKSDVIEAGEVTDRAASESFASDGVRRQRLDLSAYLELDKVFQDEQTLRLQAILSRMDDRIPDSDQARAEYDRLVKNLNEIIHNRAFDMEDIIHMVDQRVTLYIENRNYDNSALDEDLLMDYKALCILLGEDEEAVPAEQLRSRVDSMRKEYEAQPEREVIADLVNEALEKLGMKVDGYCVLDGQLEGELYSSGSDQRCKVFVSCNASGVMIEPVNFDEHADEDEVADAQRAVCQAERELIEEVGRNGIRLQKVYSKEHAPDQIATKSDLALQESVVEENDNPLEKLRESNRRRKDRRRKTESRSLSL